MIYLPEKDKRLGGEHFRGVLPAVKVCREKETSLTEENTYMSASQS